VSHSTFTLRCGAHHPLCVVSTIFHLLVKSHTFGAWSQYHTAGILVIHFLSNSLLHRIVAVSCLDLTCNHLLVGFAGVYPALIGFLGVHMLFVVFSGSAIPLVFHVCFLYSSNSAFTSATLAVLIATCIFACSSLDSFLPCNTLVATSLPAFFMIHCFRNFGLLIYVDSAVPASDHRNVQNHGHHTIVPIIAHSAHATHLLYNHTLAVSCALLKSSYATNVSIFLVIHGIYSSSFCNLLYCDSLSSDFSAHLNSCFLLNTSSVISLDISLASLKASSISENHGICLRYLSFISFDSISIPFAFFVATHSL
jgi:hypothetical protein